MRASASSQYNKLFIVIFLVCYLGIEYCVVSNIHSRSWHAWFCPIWLNPIGEHCCLASVVIIIFVCWKRQRLEVIMPPPPCMDPYCHPPYPHEDTINGSQTYSRWGTGYLHTKRGTCNRMDATELNHSFFWWKHTLYATICLINLTIWMTIF